jgi:epsilon-lactone hydrolase
MPSLRSALVIFMVKHRHWFHRQWKRMDVDRTTSIPELRRRVEHVARVFGRLPAGVDVSPVSMDGLYGEWVRVHGSAAGSVILYFHGGGYVMGSCRAYRSVVANVAAGSGVDALTFDYRLAPEHPFPAALDDSIAAYQWLLSQQTSPSRIVFAGDSAGGGLCLAALLAIRDRNLPLPRAAVVLSPWTDLTCSGESHMKEDPLAYKGCFPVFSAYYAGTHDPAEPMISPLFGDLTGLPPLLMYVGEREHLLDDSVRFAEKARAFGVAAVLNVGRGMVHCYPLLSPLFPEAKEAMDEICKFISTHAADQTRSQPAPIE